MCHPRLLSLSALLVLTSGIRSEPPQWWTEGANPVLDSGAVPNNRGPANIGQAKHMAKSALDALATVLPSTAAAVEQDLTVPQSNPAGGTFPVILDFTVPDPKTPEWIELQKAPLLTGQLKAIAHPFYFHLDAAASVWLAEQRAANGIESGGIFPWTDDLSDDNHHGMANIGQLKAVFSLHFTRDTDEDGLPDLTEHVLGTNPDQPMTFPGIPDAWVKEHFQTAQGFDPDGDPAGDGITNAEKYQLGLDPHTHYITGLVNPGFDEIEPGHQPTLSFRPENPADLYEQGSIPGWQADIGAHIEIWNEGNGNTYAELQSHCEAHGLKQVFDMIPGTQLDFIVRYKGRYEFHTPYDNAFDLKVEGASLLRVNGSPASASGSHPFMGDDVWEKYTDWHYAAVSITAESGGSGLKEITLSLVPKTTSTYGANGEEEITRGGFVDIIVK